MVVNKTALILLIVLSTFFLNKECISQASQRGPESYKGSFLLSGRITLDSLTRYVHKSSGIRFSFNSSRVKGSKEISFEARRYTLNELLQLLRKTTSLHYTFYSGYVVFQDNPPAKQKNGASRSPAPASTKTTPKAPAGKQTRINNAVVTTNNKRAIPSTKGISPRPVPDSARRLPSAIDNSNDSKNLQSLDTNKVTIIPKANLLPRDSLADRLAASDSTNRVKTNPIARRLPENIRTTSTKNDRADDKGAFHFGMQWNIPIPINGTWEYFRGKGGKNNYYNLVIPGVWISRTLGNESNELLLLIKPFQDLFPGKNILHSEVMTRTTPTDTFLVRTEVIVKKMNSSYAGLQYNYYYTPQFSIGVGINYHIVSWALGKVKTTRLSNGESMEDATFSIDRSSVDWKYLNPNFLAGIIDLSYVANRVRLGLSFEMPFSPVLNNPLSAERSFSGRLFIRWGIK